MIRFVLTIIISLYYTDILVASSVIDYSQHSKKTVTKPTSTYKAPLLNEKERQRLERKVATAEKKLGLGKKTESFRER